jgi:hypothetical protein
MRAAGIAGVSRRRSAPITTRQATDHHPASDLVRRNFMADRANELWLADITFLPTLAGFLYLAVVLDAWSRRIVGWAFSADLKTPRRSRRSRHGAHGRKARQRRPSFGSRFAIHVGLDEAVLPWTAPLNVGHLGANGSDPVLQGLGDELRPVVGSDVFRYAAQNELIGQHVDCVGRTQHLCDLPIAKAAVPPGQLADVRGQPLLIVWSPRNPPLGGPMLSEHPADPPLGQSQLASNMVDASAAARGA